MPSNKICLGHFFTDDSRDDRDIYRQCHNLHAQTNMLILKFSIRSTQVKCLLLKAYCTSTVHKAYLWYSYKRCWIQRLKVANSGAMRTLLQVPRWNSSSQLFLFCDVPTCKALLRHSVYNFMCRLDGSENSIIEALTNPRKRCFQYVPRLRKH